MTRFLFIALFVSPLFLTACSVDWERIQVDQDRTAGGVVSYVRASMLPKKDLRLEPISAPTARAEEMIEAVEPVEKIDEKHSEAVEQMQEMFRDEQRK